MDSNPGSPGHQCSVPTAVRVPNIIRLLLQDHQMAMFTVIMFKNNGVLKAWWLIGLLLGPQVLSGYCVIIIQSFINTVNNSTCNV